MGIPESLRDCNSCIHHVQGAHPADVTLGHGPYARVTCQDCLTGGLDRWSKRMPWHPRNTLNSATPADWDAATKSLRDRKPAPPQANPTPTATAAENYHAKRKATPVFSGMLMYFPDAVAEVARVSLAGNEQHHPGTPLHWDKAKSKDEADACVRHLMDSKRETFDIDGQRHSAKAAWRALAHLQRELDGEKT